MEFRARVINGVLVPNEPNQLPEGREVVLSLVEVSDEPALKSEFETILDRMETAYDELGELLSQRRVGAPDAALEAQITAKKEELAQLKKQSTSITSLLRWSANSRRGSRALPHVPITSLS